MLSLCGWLFCYRAWNNNTAHLLINPWCNFEWKLLLFFTFLLLNCLHSVHALELFTFKYLFSTLVLHELCIKFIIWNFIFMLWMSSFWISFGYPILVSLPFFASHPTCWMINYNVSCGLQGCIFLHIDFLIKSKLLLKHGFLGYGYMATDVVCVSDICILAGIVMAATNFQFDWRKPPY